MLNKKNIMTLSQFNREVLGTSESDVHGKFDILKPKKPILKPSGQRTVVQEIDHDLIAEKVAEKLKEAQSGKQPIQPQNISTKDIVSAIKKEMLPMMAASKVSGIINPQDSDPVVAVLPQNSGLKTTGSIGEEKSSAVSDLDRLFELTVPDHK